MNITDSDGRWRVTWKPGLGHQIENRKTGEVRNFRAPPGLTLDGLAGAISGMHYPKFLRKCETAFDTGIWPATEWSSGQITL